MSLRTKINVGALKHQVDILSVNNEVDEFGFQQEEYIKISTVRTKVEFDNRLMREVFKDNGADSTNVKIFTIRFIPGINTRNKLRFKDCIYEIYGINNIDEEDRFLMIWARMIW